MALKNFLVLTESIFLWSYETLVDFNEYILLAKILTKWTNVLSVRVNKF